MTAALGRNLVLLALLASTIGAVVGGATAARGSALGWAWTRRLAYLFAAAMVAANGLMVWALLARDFSISYVAQVGSLSVPNWVAVVSLWSSLEGSILFWGLVIGGYVGVATWANRDRHPEYMPWAVAVWLACGAFFSFLLAGPAQPFQTVSPVPADGPGPNPLLQNHLLMAIHPPFLYLGYVGMTIPFGLASAALLTGRLGHDFLRPLRTWLMLPWTFLTVAIVLGGWWAYEVLGWGGYWAWDPVENASLLPWLTATAALHSALLTERKGVLKGWTVTLVLATFLLTLLGTFMTRSGVFNSVHSFTQSAIGPTIFVFLVLALAWSIALLALRIDRLAAEGTIEPALGRDSLFLVNNLLFVLFTFTVLLGTVFPLLVEALRGVQMSVGRPYFDRMAVPLGIALLLLMGVGPALPWGRATPAQVRQALVPPLASRRPLRGRRGGARGAPAVDARGARVRRLHAARDRARAVAARRAAARARREPGAGARRGRASVHGRRRFGSYVVHAGAAIVIVAIAVSSTMGTSREAQLKVGETTQVGAYTLTFLSVDQVSEPHREAVVANVGVSRGGRDLGVLSPRMNQYERQREPIGTPAVRSSLFEDLYLSVMNIDPASGSLGLLAMVNPMVGWIWAATGLMALGSLVSLVPSRAETRP